MVLTWDLGGVTSSQSTCVASSVPIRSGNSRLRVGRRAPRMSIASRRDAGALAGVNSIVGQVVTMEGLPDRLPIYHDGARPIAVILSSDVPALSIRHGTSVVAAAGAS